MHGYHVTIGLMRPGEGLGLLRGCNRGALGAAKPETVKPGRMPSQKSKAGSTPKILCSGL